LDAVGDGVLGWQRLELEEAGLKVYELMGAGAKRGVERVG
jgi:hypothetical protein